MHWNYRVVKTPTDTCESYGIHEVYYDSGDRPAYYTEKPVLTHDDVATPEKDDEVLRQEASHEKPREFR